MKRGIKTIAAGSVLFILGAFIIPLLVLIPLFLERSNDFQFVVPGKVEAAVEKPGRYYLWNDFRTMHEGRSYDRSEHLPDGLEIEIRDTKGQPLRFFSDSSITSSVGTSSKKSIGYVEMASPGKVEIEIAGSSEERVFSFSQSGILKMLGLILGGFALSMLVALTGIALIVWGIVKYLKPIAQPGRL